MSEETLLKVSIRICRSGQSPRDPLLLKDFHYSLEMNQKVMQNKSSTLQEVTCKGNRRAGIRYSLALGLLSIKTILYNR